MNKKTIILFFAFASLFFYSQAQEDNTLRQRVDSVMKADNNNTAFQDPEAPMFNFISSDENFIMGIGGFVRMLGLYDFDGLVNNVDFITYDIPTPNSPEQNRRFALVASKSRLFTKLIGNTGKGKIIGYLEADFTGTGGTFKLRKAYVKFRGLLVGQTTSTFMDNAAGPPTVDGEGPNSEIYSRVPMIKYEGEILKNWILGISIEMPKMSASYDSLTFEVPQRFPDIPARIRYKRKWGHIQLAGIIRDLSYGDSLNTKNKNDIGWGYALSSKLTFAKKNTIYFQTVYGKGIANYIQDIASAGLDLVPSTTNNLELDALIVYGGYLGFQHNITKDLFVSATYGYTFAGDNGNKPPTSYKIGEYVAANVFWTFYTRTQIGLEYLWGQRTNFDNTFGTANRINALLTYSF